MANLIEQYTKTLESFNAILPPFLQGIFVWKLNHYNGCIEVEPFGFKAVIEDGVILNYPVDVDQPRRQAKCPGVNTTLVNRFDSMNWIWVDDCAPLFSLQKENCKREGANSITLSLEEAMVVEDYTCSTYYSFILKKDILRVYHKGGKLANLSSNDEKHRPGKVDLINKNFLEIERGKRIASPQDIVNAFDT